ncbi:TPA: hypothetical protein ACSP17_000990 [Aeromonas hydrophila]
MSSAEQLIPMQPQHDEQAEEVEGAEFDAQDGEQAGAEPDDGLVQPGSR